MSLGLIANPLGRASGSGTGGGGTTNAITAASPASGAGLLWLSNGANRTAVATDTVGTINATTVNVGSIGMPGNLSVDDTYAGMVITGIVNSGGVSQWDAVTINASSQWVLADANGANLFPANGLAVATTLTAVAVSVLTQGVVRNDAWSWTPRGRIYLSTTAGGLTQTAPSTSGDQVQDVGYALTADIAFFNFNGVYLTVA